MNYIVLNRQCHIFSSLAVGSDRGDPWGNCMISAKYIATKYEPSFADKGGKGISMEQTGNGNLLLGSTREFVGFNKKNTLEGIKKIITQPAGFLPVLKTFQVIRTFAGLRPYTPDDLPRSLGLSCLTPPFPASREISAILLPLISRSSTWWWKTPRWNIW